MGSEMGYPGLLSLVKCEIPAIGDNEAMRVIAEMRHSDEMLASIATQAMKRFTETVRVHTINLFGVYDNDIKHRIKEDVGPRFNVQFQTGVRSYDHPYDKSMRVVVRHSMADALYRTYGGATYLAIGEAVGADTTYKLHNLNVVEYRSPTLEHKDSVSRNLQARGMLPGTEMDERFVQAKFLDYDPIRSKKADAFLMVDVYDIHVSDLAKGCAEQGMTGGMYALIVPQDFLMNYTMRKTGEHRVSQHSDMRYKINYTTRRVRFMLPGSIPYEHDLDVYMSLIHPSNIHVDYVDNGVSTSKTYVVTCDQRIGIYQVMWLTQSASRLTDMETAIWSPVTQVPMTAVEYLVEGRNDLSRVENWTVKIALIPTPVFNSFINAVVADTEKKRESLFATAAAVMDSVMRVKDRVTGERPSHDVKHHEIASLYASMAAIAYQVQLFTRTQASHVSTKASVFRTYQNVTLYDRLNVVAMLKREWKTFSFMLHVLRSRISESESWQKVIKMLNGDALLEAIGWYEDIDYVPKYTHLGRSMQIDDEEIPTLFRVSAGNIIHEEKSRDIGQFAVDIKMWKCMNSDDELDTLVNEHEAKMSEEEDELDEAGMEYMAASFQDYARWAEVSKTDLEHNCERIHAQVHSIHTNENAIRRYVDSSWMNASATMQQVVVICVHNDEITREYGGPKLSVRPMRWLPLDRAIVQSDYFREWDTGGRIHVGAKMKAPDGWYYTFKHLYIHNTHAIAASVAMHEITLPTKKFQLTIGFPGAGKTHGLTEEVSEYIHAHGPASFVIACAKKEAAKDLRRELKKANPHVDEAVFDRRVLTQDSIVIRIARGGIPDSCMKLFYDEMYQCPLGQTLLVYSAIKAASGDDIDVSYAGDPPQIPWTDRTRAHPKGTPSHHTPFKGMFSSVKVLNDVKRCPLDIVVMINKARSVGVTNVNGTEYKYGYYDVLGTGTSEIRRSRYRVEIPNLMAHKFIPGVYILCSSQDQVMEVLLSARKKGFDVSQPQYVSFEDDVKHNRVRAGTPEPNQGLGYHHVQILIYKDANRQFWDSAEQVLVAVSRHKYTVGLVTKLVKPTLIHSLFNMKISEEEINKVKSDGFVAVCKKKTGDIVLDEYLPLINRAT